MAAKPIPVQPPLAWEATPEVDAVWLAEARRRLSEADAGHAVSLTLDDVRARLAVRR